MQLPVWNGRSARVIPIINTGLNRLLRSPAPENWFRLGFFVLPEGKMNDRRPRYSRQFQGSLDQDLRSSGPMPQPTPVNRLLSFLFFLSWLNHLLTAALSVFSLPSDVVSVTRLRITMSIRE